MKKKSNKAFTLVEMVVAIALGAIVLVAASSLLLTITQLWIKGENLDDFQGHIHGVKTFLQKHIKQSAYRINDNLPPVQGERAIKSSSESYISFYVYMPNPLLGMDSMVPVVCYLDQDDRGLSIIWHSLEKPDGKGDLPVYSRLLSPWVKGMKFYYTKDNKNWEKLDKLKEEGGKFLVPAFIELQFSKDNEPDQSTFIQFYGDQKPEEAIL